MKKIEEASTFNLQNIQLKKVNEDEETPRWKIMAVAIATGRVTL